MAKYILVTGGVISGIGKGVIASSTAALMKNMGLKVTNIKIDPYLNIDAGTMSPYEHGEVYVLKDGAEVDLDLGCYERFVGNNLTGNHNITTGKIYKSVIEKERRGEYLGKTVQVVTHVCAEIQDWIERVADDNDICTIELGGTIGDIESMPFVEALRQFQFRVKQENFFHIHVSLIPEIGTNLEQKTKPTQNGVKELRALGLSPDVIICRSKNPIYRETIEKISQFCHVDTVNVIGCPDVTNLYRVPILLLNSGLTDSISKKFRLNNRCDMQKWKEYAELYDGVNNNESILLLGIIGKYNGQQDSYLSIIRAVSHASVCLNQKIKLIWINAEDYVESDLEILDGILIPGGFGIRGTEGKVQAAKYARESGKPFLGICYGFQIGIIEYCRNVLGITNANTEEISGDESDIIINMPDLDKGNMGGTMRLGEKETIVKSGSLADRLYKGRIIERHRHRYEVNPYYVERIEDGGMTFTGKDTTGTRQEIFELDSHPFYIGVQYHPEFNSRMEEPSPIFLGLISSMMRNK